MRIKYIFMQLLFISLIVSKVVIKIVQPFAPFERDILEIFYSFYRYVENLLSVIVLSGFNFINYILFVGPGLAQDREPELFCSVIPSLTQ